MEHPVLSSIILAGIAAAALVVCCAAALLFARRRLLSPSLPRTKGTLAAPGIGAPVTIARDAIGVPHIDAESMEDAVYALGVAHAQDRLWQLEMTRRVAQGRVSEIVGADGLGIDRFVRRLGLPRVAAAEERQAGAEICRMLEAYAAGINSIIASGRPLPLEFRLLKTEPEPWRPVHSILAGKLLALGLSLNWDTELQRLELLRAIGPENAAKLDIVYPDANPTILSDTANAAGPGVTREKLAAMFAEAARWIPSAGGASNSWVVSADRSATGRPILCNDPHLAPSLPSIWYAAHVRAGDDFESTGVTMPGIPLVVIGHNRRVAWGFTNSFADCQDLVIEEFNGPSAERYRTERGFERTRLVREIIRVKGASDEVEEVVITRHGPIVERIEDPGRNVWRGLALQWTALTPGGAMESLLRLQRASDWDSFREAFATLDAPSQNAVYADVDGHIGYVLCGRVPVRRRPPSGLPVPGWSGDALWARFLSVQEMPSILDPLDGVIVTANNRIVGESFPHYIGSDYMNGYRALRLKELLDGDTLQLTDMARIQMDVVSPPARQVVRLLQNMTCTSPAAERVRARLAVWDAAMVRDRVEPTLYEAFVARFAEHALRPLCGDAWRIVAGVDLTHPVFEYPGNLTGRLTPSLLDRWEHEDAAILAGVTTWPEVVSRALEDAWADLRRRYGRRTRRWRWGRVHALPLVHVVGRRRPLGLIFNAGRLRVGGSMDTVMATSFMPGDPFATRLFAPSWRQVMDVGEWDACTGVHYPGQSGQPGSRHYRDLRKRWSRNRQFPLAWSAESVRRLARSRLTLRPGPPR
ncbi:MAG TPA: penicillin acylase family protein [Candidatus Dormibacteraeota bacterium]